MRFLSTSALAKERGLDSKELFDQLKKQGWIYKKDGQWCLTKEGKMAGGEIKNHPKYGEYVTWPSDINFKQKVEASQTVSSSQIGQEFKLSAQRINSIISELGWIEKNPQGGWNITSFGKKNNGFELEASNGAPYVVWSKEILSNNSFLKSINATMGISYEDSNVQKDDFGNTDEFRKKHDAKYRTQDGHRVRSRAEAMIDDYLYSNGIAHAYERRLPGIEEEVISDFYIPSGKVFIEFWGMEENERYADRKKKKLEIYASENFNLIQLTDKDIETLDDVLPRKLRKFNVSIV